MSIENELSVSLRRVRESWPRIVVVAVAGALLTAALWASGRGLNRIDDSYVLGGIAHPEASRAAGEVTFSSYLLHPLYALVGGDIARYRVVGIMAVAVLAALAMDECTRFVDAITGRPSRGWARHLLSVAAAATSLTTFTFGVRSLSYNSVVLVGLLVATVGVCRAFRGADLVGGVIIAVGWWVVFLGKPTSAAALTVVSLGALALARRLTVRVARAAAMTLVVAMAATLAAVRMTPQEATEFLVGGIEQDRLLGGHVSLLPLLGLAGGPVLALFLFGLPLALVTIVAAELVRRSQAWPSLAAGLALIGLASAAVLAVALPGLADRSLGYQILPFALSLVIVGMALVAREALARPHGRTGRQAPHRVPVCLAAWLAVMPYIAAVGTNSPFTEAMPHYAVFWLVATLVGVRAFGSPPYSPVSVIAAGAALGVTTVMLALALSDGGPETSLLASNTRVDVAGGTLLIPEQEAEVATYLNGVAARNGVTSATPVVDLTGIGPGYALQLGGRPLGRESFMGVFPGAPEAAAYALGRYPCSDQSSAWVLWARDNPWSVATKADLGGRRIPEDYTTVGSFRPVQGPMSWRGLIIEILRPSSSWSSRCES